MLFLLMLRYTEDVPYDEFDTMKAIQENVVEGYRLQIPEETPKIWVTSHRFLL